MTNGTQPIERETDIIERSLLCTRRTWRDVMALVAELHERQGIHASSEEVCGILLSAGLSAYREQAERKARQGERKARAPRKRGELCAPHGVLKGACQRCLAERARQ